MDRVIVLIVLILAMNFANGQPKNFIDQPFVETTSKVDTLITPDRIYLTILISEKDTKGKQTVEELEKLMVDKLKEIGIEIDKQLSLSDLSSNFKKYFLRKQEILKAKFFELLVYEAKTAGRVIYEMEGIGISNVDLERTEFSKAEELRLELKTKAILKAKRQAEAMIKPLNQSIGKAIFISDDKTDIVNALQGRVPGIRIRGLRTMDKEYDAIPVEFEKIKIESEVQVKFIIN